MGASFGSTKPTGRTDDGTDGTKGTCVIGFTEPSQGENVPVKVVMIATTPLNIYIKSFTPAEGGVSMCRQVHDEVWGPANNFTYDMFIERLRKIKTRETDGDNAMTYAYSDSDDELWGVGQVMNTYFIVTGRIPTTIMGYGETGHRETDHHIALSKGLVKLIADARASKWNAVVNLVSEHKKKAIGVGTVVAAAAIGAGAFAAYKNKDRARRRLRGTSNDVADVADTLDEARDALLINNRDQALGKLEQAQSTLADVWAATGLGEGGESDYEDYERGEEEDRSATSRKKLAALALTAAGVGIFTNMKRRRAAVTVARHEQERATSVAKQEQERATTVAKQEHERAAAAKQELHDRRFNGLEMITIPPNVEVFTFNTIGEELRFEEIGHIWRFLHNHSKLIACRDFSNFRSTLLIGSSHMKRHVGKMVNYDFEFVKDSPLFGMWHTNRSNWNDITLKGASCKMIVKCSKATDNVEVKKLCAECGPTSIRYPIESGTLEHVLATVKNIAPKDNRVLRLFIFSCASFKGGGEINSSQAWRERNEKLPRNDEGDIYTVLAKLMEQIKQLPKIVELNKCAYQYSVLTHGSVVTTKTKTMTKNGGFGIVDTQSH